MIPVAKDRIVSFYYRMINGKGEVTEQTTESALTSYLHGSKSIQPHLQKQLEGLVAGEIKIIYLSETNKQTAVDYSFEVTIHEVREAISEEIILGYPVQLVAGVCDANCACFIHNHKLVL